MLFGALGQYALGQGPAGGTAYELIAEGGTVVASFGTTSWFQTRVLKAGIELATPSHFLFAALGQVAFGQSSDDLVATHSINFGPTRLLRSRRLVAEGMTITVTTSDAQYGTTKRMRTIRPGGGSKVASKAGSIS